MINVKSKYQYLFLIIWLAWILFVFYKNIVTVVSGPFWVGYNVPWEKALYLILPVFGSILVHFVSCFFKWSLKRLFVYYLSGIGLFVIAVNPDRFIVFKIMAFILAAVGHAFFGVALVRKILKIEIAAWLGFLINAILLHHLFFIFSFFEKLIPAIVFGIIIIIGILGMSYIFRARKNFLVKNRKWLDLQDLTLLDMIISTNLFVLLVLSFITATAPQTYADGIAERLPYLNYLKSFFTFPPHLYRWGVVLPKPMVLLMVPGFYALGEIGATWTLFLFTIATLFMLRNLYFELLNSYMPNVNHGNQSSIISAYLCLLMTTSPFWILTTCIYFDIEILLFSLSGFYCILLAKQNSRYFYLGFLLWGFATSIKLNAPILLVFLFVATAFYKGKFVWNFRQIVIGCFAALLVYFPWLFRQTQITGNPLFPFLGGLSNHPFQSAEVLTAEALAAFGFKGKFLEFLNMPWRLTFSTGNFGEYLNGTFGPGWLAFIPCYMFGLFARVREEHKYTNYFSLIVGSILCIYLTSLALNASIFRYWLTAFFLLQLLFFMNLDVALPDAKRFFNIVIGLLIVLSGLFLILIGARNNFGLQHGFGDQIWRGELSREDLLDQKTGGVEKFVNRNIKLGESVMVNTFHFANLINAPVFNQSNLRAYEQNVETVKSYRDFIKKNNIKFLIIPERNELIVDQAIKDEFLGDSRVVYGSGNFMVLSLMDFRGKPKLVINPDNGGNTNFERKLNWYKLFDPNKSNSIIAKFAEPIALDLDKPLGVYLIRIEIELDSSVKKSNLIFQSICFDENLKEIKRRSAGQGLDEGNNQRIFYFDLIDSCRKIRIEINPWQVNDGIYHLKRSLIEFY
jgi:hypothetical protein